MATLLLSQGVPMILAGDELSNTQQGNNNGYCQDNEITWLDWDLDGEIETPDAVKPLPPLAAETRKPPSKSSAKKAFLDFVRRLIEIRLGEPTLRRRRFFLGRPIRGTNIKDIYWLDPTGKEMDDAAWNAGFNQCIGVLLVGQSGEMDERGEQIVGDNLLLLMNAHYEPIPFALPPVTQKFPHLELILDTSEAETQPCRVDPKTPFNLQGRTLALFRWPIEVKEVIAAAMGKAGEKRMTPLSFCERKRYL